MCKAPALTATAFVIPSTCTGVDEHQRGSCVHSTPGREIPLPSCPSTFRPQHHTVPFPRSAQVWLYPPVTAMGLLGSPLTRVGGFELLPGKGLPSPSCPWSFTPQHCTPSPSSAQV